MSAESEKRMEEIARDAVALADLLYEEIGKLTARPVVAWSAVCRLVNVLHYEFTPLERDKETTLARIKLLTEAIGAELSTAPAKEQNGAALRHRGPRVFRRRP